jgi:GST-like protein
MIDLFYWGTPNGHKISIALEELALPYEVHAVNIGRGDQFKPEFLAVSPNNRIPAIVDREPKGGGPPISVFESGAILLYLAEKTGRLLSADLRERTQTIEWLMWQMAGVGPMFGQANHFWGYAPEDIPYAKERYLKETKRLFKVLDVQLAGREYIAGAGTGAYSIADIANFAWVRSTHRNPKVPVTANEYPNVGAWLERVGARPAVVKGLAVETPQTEMDEEAREHLFGSGQDR